MCGIVVSLDSNPPTRKVDAAQIVQLHRGPDSGDTWISQPGFCCMGHRRLSILDLSNAGNQPMISPDGRYVIVFNGEIYNYIELRAELAGRFEFSTNTDTEVLLASFIVWGADCLQRLNGMFSFAIWDEREKQLFAARDRFGVKPFFYHVPKSGALWIASEIKALHALGAPKSPCVSTWASYLVNGMYDHDGRSFWEDINRLPSGCFMTWSPGKDIHIEKWYDLVERFRLFNYDLIGNVQETLESLLYDSVRLRFRSDVPVGICLSSGLDSSLLLGLIQKIQGNESCLNTFTFTCGDPSYDEDSAVGKLLSGTNHTPFFCRLTPSEVPELALAVQQYQDEPFGGIPTLGMAKVHDKAREQGVGVLLDGNGLDESWAGYEYYRNPTNVDLQKGPVQGSSMRTTRSDCLETDFIECVQPFTYDSGFGDELRNLQHRDLFMAKIPRAMRFADRVSMMYSRELREPFLDYRIVELGVFAPSQFKIWEGIGKWTPRVITGNLPIRYTALKNKQSVQTPQREWLRGPLADWADECVEQACNGFGKPWLKTKQIRRAWHEFRINGADNSFPIWQWISLGMMNLNLEVRSSRRDR